MVRMKRDRTRSMPRQMAWATPPTVLAHPTASSIHLQGLIDRA